MLFRMVCQNLPTLGTLQLPIKAVYNKNVENSNNIFKIYNDLKEKNEMYKVL